MVGAEIVGVFLLAVDDEVVAAVRAFGKVNLVVFGVEGEFVVHLNHSFLLS